MRLVMRSLSLPDAREVAVIKSILFCLALLAIPLFAVAADNVFDAHPSTAPVVDSEPVLQLYVTLSDKITLGETDNGVRHIVPITGGHFIGRGIAGEVMSGGADWQLDRKDGVRSISALYSIRTNDGQVIVVDNRGISVMSEDDRYRMTNPKFHAPAGKYEWLNKRVFVGTITSIRSPRAVIIRVYEVD